MENNDIFKEELKTTITEYLTQIRRIKDYNIEYITNYLNKVKMLDNMFYNGKNNTPMEYVLHYFEKVQKPVLVNC